VERIQDAYLSLKGCKIRYRDSGGAGLPVLLSHGIGESLEFWDLQTAAALPNMRLISWDFPNHGLSDLSGKVEDFDSYADWALAFVQALSLERFLAVGNSMGAAVSLRLAGLAPSRLAGVVLANSAGLGPEVTPVFRLFSLPLLGELLNKPNPKAAEMQIKAIVKDPASVSEPLRAAISRNLSKQGGSAAFLATLRATLGLRGQNKAVWQKSHDLLSALTCPLLILHGRQDSVLPHRQSEAAAGLAARAELMILEDCGHTPQIEKPAVFNQALAGFAKSLA
jgi:2-hydroxy-6-oxonona-2,4-dienedioate hydrolase